MSEGLHELSALDLGRAIAARDVSPVEVAQHFLDRIDRLDPKGERWGAFVTVTRDLALAQAREQEAVAARGGLASPLAGVPVPVKDLNHVQGVPISYGSAVYAGFVAPFDDHVVRRMRAAGTVCLGKTSTPEFGLPCYTETLIGPPARTPWDRTRGAGGSSGGAAAAVAAGLAPLAQGSDGGGSIRIPASSCGLFGLKPSRGRVSNGPLGGDVGPGLGVIGPIAWTVADAAALLDIMAGPELGDPHWAPPLPPGETFSEHARRAPGRLRIARFRAPVVGQTEVHPECIAAYDAASALLERLGHEVVDIEAPIPPAVVPSFEVVWSVLATLAPVPPGREGELMPLTRHLRGRGRPVSAHQYAEAVAAMQTVSREAIEGLAAYDAVLTPTLADLPAPVGSLRDDDDPAADFEAQKRFTPFTALWNVTGMPAVTLPLHQTGPLPGAPGGLPVGVMLAGRPAGEAALLGLASQIEGEDPWQDRRADMTDFDTSPPSPALAELARSYDVSTEYWDWRGRHVLVSAGTIRAVLRAFDVDVQDDAAVAAALAANRDRQWRQTLPPVVVLREGAGAQVKVHVPDGDSVQLWVELESGGRVDQHQAEAWVPPRTIDGVTVGEATFELSTELPLGWHRLNAETPQGISTAPLVVTPNRMELPEVLSARRAWGFMTQLYSVRSSQSWGIGDLADLAELAGWSGGLGADYVLVNPLSAASPVPPMEPSPYLPTTRRFVNPVYIRVEDIREVAYMSSAERQLLEWHADDAHQTNDSDRIDRDVVWAAKSAALEIVHRLPRSPARQRAYDDFRRQQGSGLVDFATWCALAEAHGEPEDWPEGLLDPHSTEVAAERARLGDRVDFHSWLQWVVDDQLAYAQRTARGAGMGLGVVQDLPVGVHPRGADAWTFADALAEGVSVGAPPDQYNQVGQDWSQPPMRPDRLAALGYLPFRDMVRTVLRHAGGLRVDHVIGLFRLWWVPEGQAADQGTYVRYDHEALVGILALEAQRAGAVVIGEDLGTVEPWVRDYLRDRGIFGTSILWFEKDAQGRPLEPERYRELCLATVTTHDLPPTAGYLAGEHIRLREQLGLLTRPIEEEWAEDERDRVAMLDLLRRRGLLQDDASTQATIQALHRLIAWTPARMIGVALTDAVGEVRTINQPGTDKEYPNWQLPLSDGHGRPVLLEELVRSRRARDLARAAATG